MNYLYCDVIFKELFLISIYLDLFEMKFHIICCIYVDAR
jgi:hypothetical protein